MGNPSDVPPDDLYIHSFVGMIRGSVKPNVYTAKNRADMEDIYRIAVAVTGGDQALRETRFLLSGVEVNPTTLALDAIAHVRPGAGFLADDHTLDNWKWAQWRPELIDRSRYDHWLKRGRKDMFTRANERAREILKEHEVPPLPEEAEAVIGQILEERAASGRS
jgi:trimethylamine:corrinoid methyltransferase-like protein